MSVGLHWMFRDRWDVWIFTLSLLLRLGVLGVLIMAFGVDAPLMLGDSHQYLRLAEGMFSGTFADPDFPDLIEGTRPPGYPGYLWLFLISGVPLWAASILQITIVSFIPLLAMRLAHEFGLPRTVERLAGVITAIEPLGILYSVTLLSDAFGALFFLLGAYVLLRFWNVRRFHYVVISAIVLGGVNYIRPIGLVFFIWIPLVMLFAGWFTERARWREHLKGAAAFGAVFFLVLVPWMTRNYYHFGAFQFLSAAERHLYDYSAVAVRAAAEGTTYEEMRQRMRREILPYLPEPRDIRQFANREVLRNRAVEIIKEHPREYTKLYIFSLQTFLVSGNYHYLLAFYGLIDRPEGGNKSFTVLFAGKNFHESWEAVKMFLQEPYGLIALGGRVFWGILFLLSLVGVWLMWRYVPEARFGVTLYVSFLLYLATVTLHLVTGIEARHRLFLNPFYFIFASVGALFAWEKLRWWFVRVFSRLVRGAR